MRHHLFPNSHVQFTLRTKEKGVFLPSTSTSGTEAPTDSFEDIKAGGSLALSANRLGLAGISKDSNVLDESLKTSTAFSFPPHLRPRPSLYPLLFSCPLHHHHHTHIRSPIHPVKTCFDLPGLCQRTTTAKPPSGLDQPYFFLE